MGLGGPVWHASVGGQLAPGVRRRLALEALAGVGDAALQWEHERPMAYHIRRRLTREEAVVVGPVVDLRGSQEARERYLRIEGRLPLLARHYALEELGGL